MTIEAKDIKESVLGVAIANKKDGSPKFEEYKANLETELQNNGDNLQDIKPFYKNDGTKNPAGYVIKTDTKIMVCYHGTQFSNLKEVWHDLQASKSEMQFGDKKYQVHTGFKKEYEASKDDLDRVLTDIQIDKPLEFSGHSLGGAVSHLAALDYKTRENPPQVKGVVTFGSPRIFSKESAVEYNNLLGQETVRVKQKADLVPKIPPKALFSHVGKKISMDAGTNSIHTGNVYRKLSNKIDETSMSGARSSSSMENSSNSIDSYVQQVMQFFSKAKQNIKDKVNGIRKALTQSAHSSISSIVVAAGKSLTKDKANQL